MFAFPWSFMSCLQTWMVIELDRVFLVKCPCHWISLSPLTISLHSLLICKSDLIDVINIMGVPLYVSYFFDIFFCFQYSVAVFGFCHLRSMLWSFSIWVYFSCELLGPLDLGAWILQLWEIFALMINHWSHWFVS